MADPSETTQVSADPSDAQQAELLGAVRALSAQVGGLQAELRSLRAQTRPLPAPEGDAPGWEDRTPARRESSAWIRSLDGPAPRAPAVPRLLLEIVFLAVVAVGVVLADLDAPAIVAVMAVAWLLVALAEWTAAQAAKRRGELVDSSLAGIGGVFADDPSWFAPPVERTELEVVEEGEDTATKLPRPSPE
jgi:hypothetical protein